MTVKTPLPKPNLQDHNRHTNNLTEIGCEITIDEESIDINKNNAWMEGRRVVQL